MRCDWRREAFEKMFSRRIEALRRDARLMANLSNPYNYTYEEQDIALLRAEVAEILQSTVDAFEKRMPKQETLQEKRKTGQQREV